MWKGYIGSFLILNPIFHPFGDYFFPIITHLGDAGVSLSILFLLTKNSKHHEWISAIITLILAGIVVWLCKEYFFHVWDRPWTIFSGNTKVVKFYKYPFIGIERFNSFPSGHSTTIFGITTVIAFSRILSLKMQILLFTIAILVGFSRIYIGVHFPGDVVAGAILGCFFALCTFYFMPYLNSFINLYLAIPRFKTIITYIAIGILIWQVYYRGIYSYLGYTLKLT